MRKIIFLLCMMFVVSVYGYDRREYGIWGHEGCLTTREIVLIRDAIEIELDESGCTIVSGLWLDVYTNLLLDDIRKIDIDHVVPLSYVDNIVGNEWSKEQKEIFGNDINNLLITRNVINRSKGSRGLISWLPIVNKCRYVMVWENIGTKYNIPYKAEDQKIIDKYKGCNK